MFGTLITLAIGVVIGWALPQPAWAGPIVEKAKEIWATIVSKVKKDDETPPPAA